MRTHGHTLVSRLGHNARPGLRIGISYPASIRVLPRRPNFKQLSGKVLDGITESSRWSHQNPSEKQYFKREYREPSVKFVQRDNLPIQLEQNYQSNKQVSAASKLIFLYIKHGMISENPLHLTAFLRIRNSIVVID